MDIWIPCNPPKSTHQASQRIMKRKNGPQFIGKMETSKGRAVQQSLTALLLPHQPAAALEGPIELVVRWHFPWRKSEPKRNRALGAKWCDKRPDADNIVKLPLDVMTRLAFWNDDSQIARLVVEKRWADAPGIGIECTPLDEHPLY